MGVWLGKNILGQVDEIRHDMNGSMGLNLVVVMPRELPQAGRPSFSGAARQLMEAGEAEETIEIESADYKKVSDAE
jgi:hypothetical protein